MRRDFLTISMIALIGASNASKAYDYPLEDLCELYENHFSVASPYELRQSKFMPIFSDLVRDYDELTNSSDHEFRVVRSKEEFEHSLTQLRKVPEKKSLMMVITKSQFVGRAISAYILNDSIIRKRLSEIEYIIIDYNFGSEELLKLLRRYKLAAPSLSVMEVVEGEVSVLKTTFLQGCVSLEDFRGYLGA